MGGKRCFILSESSDLDPVDLQSLTRALPLVASDSRCLSVTVFGRPWTLFVFLEPI